ncbi:MAG: hypothetical protein R3E09_13185 [Novosphingobium sp.]|nr:hypothetical protein [Novosphingobium sp.]
MRIVDNHDLSRETICSKAFRAYRMADSYRELSARLGQDFGASIALLDRLPTFMSGEAHKRTRRAMARRNEISKPAQLAATDDFLAKFAARRLKPGESVELMQDFSRPLFQAIIAAASTFHELPDDIVSLVERFPALFSSHTPLKQRFETNTLLERILDRNGSDILDDLALMVLGIYPLTGSVARTLHAVIRENPDTRLKDLVWPDYFSQSALHYVDRVCVGSATIGEEPYAPEDRVRCMIQSPGWSEAENRAMTFGAGSHLCLGRNLSELVWAKVVGMFAEHDLFADAGELVMQRGSEPFELPECAEVTFRK